MAAVLVVAFVGSVLAFFAWLSVSVRRLAQREVEALARSSCPACGAPYGISRAEQARATYFAECDRVRRAKRDGLVDFAYEWPVTCASCGARAKYRPKSGALTETS